MWRRKRRIDAASRAHRKMIDILYPRRNDSQVTNLGTYRTNYGRTRRAPR